MNNKLIATTLGIVVAVVILGGVMMPAIEDGKTAVGDPVTVDNSVVTPLYKLSEVRGDAMIVIGQVDGVLSITVNGTSAPIQSAANMNVISSDAVSGNPNAAGTLVSLTFADGTTQVVNGSNVAKLSISDGVMTATYNDSEIFAGPVSKIFAISPTGTWIGHNISDPITVRSISDITGSGAVAIGGNQVLWFVDNGKVVGSEGYTFKMTYDMTAHEGTSDLFDVTNIVISVTDGDGVDHPASVSRLLTHEAVGGHSDSGAMVSLIASIPVLVIVAILVLAVGVVTVGRSER